ncbi:MAG TPA: NAD-dependent deacylase [Firmicutes bacterium]|nr:NAD-dependent deacylase [Bacillota bacterium]
MASGADIRGQNDKSQDKSPKDQDANDRTSAAGEQTSGAGEVQYGGDNNGVLGEGELVKAAQLIAGSRYCVVLTGAGISTESGIPDFRSPGTGLWSRVDPVRVLSATAFEERPEEFYRFVMDLCEPLAGAEPNDAHRALAELERLGYVKAVITQNIDGLHQKAGSRRVLEVHGNARTGTCTGCGLSLSMEDILARARSGEVPPRCEACGWPLKPDIVLFEDPLPDDFLYAQREVRDSDLLLIIGSSLEVAPACYLPSMAQRIIIINLQPTPYDARADVVIRGRAGETMKRLVKLVLISTKMEKPQAENPYREGKSL